MEPTLRTNPSMSLSPLRDLQVAWRLLRRDDWTLPDFIVIGAQKSGTTSLYKNLVRHAQILPAIRKEVHYFDRYAVGSPFEFARKPLDWYRAHFPSAAELATHNAITGEATPVYLSHGQIAEQVAQVLPDVKLIVMLREPVARSYSQYQMRVRNADTEPPPFAQVVAEEMDFLEQHEINSDFFRHYADMRHEVGLPFFLLRSIYVAQLEPWFQHFPPDQLLILNSAEYFAHPPTVLNQICEFLGVDSWVLDYEKETSQKGDYLPLDAAVSARLRDFFAPHNERLFALIGRRFDWPSLESNQREDGTL